VVDVAPVVEAAHAVGALVYVDAVHSAPHRLLDVESLGCDFLAVSVYKFFGPHVGVVYGRHGLLREIDAYKVKPAPSDPPGKWETGTQSFEALAGVTATVDYLASLGSDGATRRGSLEMAYAAIDVHERSLAERFVAGLADVSRARLYGVGEAGADRVPTFAVGLEGQHPKDVVKHLIDRGIYVWSGHHYAVNVMDRLGVLDRGGLVRIGFTHYNTGGEVDRVLEALSEL
jgi:selenocysteine lyase/cysteine desulfurase